MFVSSKLERSLSQKGYTRICGIDEVGRGSLAGPLVLAGVILPLKTRLKGLNDSKKVSPKMRTHLDEQIKKQAIDYHIAQLSNDIIDRINIWQSCILGIKEIISVLHPDYVLLDGIAIKSLNFPHTAIKGGDGKVRVIASASIIAKVFRDQIMVEYMKEYPQYFFEKHKGYSTKLHQECLEKFGPCAIHRKSYYPVSKFF